MDATKIADCLQFAVEGLLTVQGFKTVDKHVYIACLVTQ